MPRPKMTPEEFWNKVDKTAGPDKCWPWTGCKGDKGYGATSIGGCQMGSHRVAYLFHHGVIDANLQVCHTCDNPPCCNPNHLWQGTGRQNTKDMVSKGRQSKGDKHSAAVLPNRPRGEAHYASKVSESQIIEIRNLRNTTKMTIEEIGIMFGLSEGATQKIIYGGTWRHLGAPRLISRACGESRADSKLTNELVLKIRWIRSATNRSYQSIADEFGIGMRTVADVITRKTWNHI